MTIGRGTTPSLLLLIKNVDLSNYNFYVTLSQGCTSITLTDDRVIHEVQDSGTLLCVSLTQAETLTLAPGDARVEVKAISSDGTTVKTAEGAIEIEDTLYEQIVPTPEPTPPQPDPPTPTGSDLWPFLAREGSTLDLTGYVGPIPGYACYGWDALETVIAPGVTSVGKFAFQGLASLKEVDISGASVIGESCFEACYGLRKVSLSPNLDEIPDYAFNSAFVRYINLDNIKTIGRLAFSGLALSEVRLPNVEQIGQKAFYICELLSTVYLGDKVQEIDTTAFQGCPELKNLYVPWAEGEIPGAPWGARQATIHYNSEEV